LRSISDEKVMEKENIKKMPSYFRNCINNYLFVSKIISSPGMVGSKICGVMRTS